jgi:hypothetical protein
MSASCDISGFMRGMAQARARVRGQLEKSLKRFAFHVMGDSQVLTPVDTGDLKSQHAVGPVEWMGQRLTVEAGANMDYAAAVHERLDLHHKHPTQAKYLETALKKNAPKFSAFVAGEMRAMLGN